MKYYQCILKNKNKTQTSWIPEKYAKVNKVLRIGDEDGWRVRQVHSHGVDEKEAMMHAHIYRTHRRVTDI